MARRIRLTSVFLAFAMVWATGCASHLTAVTNPSERPLAIAVHPPLGLAPRDVTVAFRIDRERDARAWCVAMVQGEFVTRRTCEDDSGARFRQVTFFNLDEGQYVAALTVVFGDGHVETISVKACYQGRTEGLCTEGS